MLAIKAASLGAGPRNFQCKFSVRWTNTPTPGFLGRAGKPVYGASAAQEPNPAPLHETAIRQHFLYCRLAFRKRRIERDHFGAGIVPETLRRSRSGCPHTRSSRRCPFSRSLEAQEHRLSVDLPRGASSAQPEGRCRKRTASPVKNLAKIVRVRFNRLASRHQHGETSPSFPGCTGR